MTARKRTARILRTLANRMDPPLPRWYASAWQQSAKQTDSTIRNIGTINVTTTSGTRIGNYSVWITGGTLKPKAHRRRVLADYLTTPDLKKLRP